MLTLALDGGKKIEARAAAGFEYVTEKGGVMLFRKPKRYVSFA